MQPKPALALGFKHAKLVKPQNTANLQPKIIDFLLFIFFFGGGRTLDTTVKTTSQTNKEVQTLLDK